MLHKGLELLNPLWISEINLLVNYFTEREGEKELRFHLLIGEPALFFHHLHFSLIKIEARTNKNTFHCLCIVIKGH